jgi:hypothetical protein
VLLDECTHVIVYRSLELILGRLDLGHDHLFPLEFFLQYLSFICLLYLESLCSQVHLLNVHFSLLFCQFTLVYLFLAYYLYGHDRQPTFTVQLFLLVDLDYLPIYYVDVGRLPDQTSYSVGDFCMMGRDCLH